MIVKSILTTALITAFLTALPIDFVFAAGETGNLQCFGTSNCDEDKDCKTNGYIFVASEQACLDAGGHLSKS